MLHTLSVQVCSTPKTGFRGKGAHSFLGVPTLQLALEALQLDLELGHLPGIITTRTHHVSSNKSIPRP